MDWTSASIAVAGLTATVTTSAVTLTLQRRGDDKRYRRETYKAAYFDFLCALEEAHYLLSPGSPAARIGPADPDVDQRELLKKVEIARVAVDMYGAPGLRSAAYDSTLAIHRLAEPDLTDEERAKAGRQLHDARAKLVRAIRREISPDAALEPDHGDSA